MFLKFNHLNPRNRKINTLFLFTLSKDVQNYQMDFSSNTLHRHLSLFLLVRNKLKYIRYSNTISIKRMEYLSRLIIFNTFKSIRTKLIKFRYYI